MPPGQPPKYKTAGEIGKKIAEYFATGMKKRKVLIGKGEKKREIEVEVPTITGLCLFLGFCDRQSFYDYEKRPAFSCTIKKARTLIEKEYEEQLIAGNTVGAIFALKQFGWSDKLEQKHGFDDDMKDWLSKCEGSSRGLPKDD